MKAYYLQKADMIWPIYGVNSISAAREHVAEADWNRIVETTDAVHLNPATGSVDFESNWLAEGADLDGLVEVEFDAEAESWVEK